MPGYFINYQDEAITVIEQLNLHNVRLQMDFYHLQMMEGNITQKLVKYFEHIGHIQIAGVPGRHEPSIGEINYPFLFHLLDEMDYTGHVGCEYHPKAGTSSGLSWLRDFQ
jgi:hydroxypyruvate isomerase